MTPFMFFVTNLGDPLSFLLLSLCLIGLLWLHRKKRDARDFFYVMSFSVVLILLIKDLIQRPRPLVTLLAEIGYSFPSAHAMLALVFFLCLALFYESHFKSKIVKNLFILSNILMIVLISYSRVYLGVHYWTDVLGSMLIGSTVFLGYLWIRHRRYSGRHHKTIVIIGITGTNGSGKGTVVQYLRKNIPFHYYSVRDFLTHEIKKRKLKVNRDSMLNLANEWRQKFGASYVTDQLFEKAMKSGGGAIIESIRNPEEAKSLRALTEKMSEIHKKPAKFILLAVDANPQNRYQRIKKRGSATDSITLEKFLTDDAREVSSRDDFKPNLFACRDMADLVINNDGSKGQLEKQVDKFIKTIRALLK